MGMSNGLQILKVLFSYLDSFTWFFFSLLKAYIYIFIFYPETKLFNIFESLKIIGNLRNRRKWMIS